MIVNTTLMKAKVKNDILTYFNPLPNMKKSIFFMSNMFLASTQNMKVLKTMMISAGKIFD